LRPPIPEALLFHLYVFPAVPSIPSSFPKGIKIWLSVNGLNCPFSDWSDPSDYVGTSSNLFNTLGLSTPDRIEKLKPLCLRDSPPSPTYTDDVPFKLSFAGRELDLGPSFTEMLSLLGRKSPLSSLKFVWKFKGYPSEASLLAMVPPF